MIELFVSGQTVRIYTPVIAADSLRYLCAKVHFTDDGWEGYTRWCHFRQGEGAGASIYDIALDENDEITEEDALNLTVGEWAVYLTGHRGESRLTTVPVILTVKESGLVDAPLHELPLSVAEQIDAKATAALAAATELRAAAEAGDFDGRDGTSFVIYGYFDSFEEMNATVSPAAGDAYGVGIEAPYEIYIWDAVHNEWKNNGALQGPPGAAGRNGTVFTPHVDAAGNLSWSNDGGLSNPAIQNIRGPAGQDGAAGPAGPGAYQTAVQTGYTGTEATFNAALSAMPYHNARHLPNGADPIRVQTGNLEDAAVTARKLASGAVETAKIKDAAVTAAKLASGAVTGGKIQAGAVSTAYTGTLAAGSWAGTTPCSQTIAVSGLLASDTPIMDLSLSGDFGVDSARVTDFAKIYRAVTANGSLTVYALERPTAALPIRLLCIRK